MKKKGSVVEFNDQRDKELLQAFKSQLHLLGTVPLQEVFTRAAMMPASRDSALILGELSAHKEERIGWDLCALLFHGKTTGLKIKGHDR